MTIKHILSGGCSQTQDGIGGVPPTHFSNGGCSFKWDNELKCSDPKSWVSFVAQDLNVDSLINTASSSHGNQLISNSIIEMLTRYQYNPGETLILFNITWPTRLDIPCDFDHPDRSKFVPWTQDLIPYTYLDNKSKPVQHCYKHMGADQVEQMNCISLINLFNFLENNNFLNYKFILAKDFSEHKNLSAIIKSRQQNFIPLDTINQGIVEFVTANNLNRDIIHPSVEGHKIISNIVIDFLKGV
jgi:hypothetical protein